jgi:hypothetical protein
MTCGVLSDVQTQTDLKFSPDGAVSSTHSRLYSNVSVLEPAGVCQRRRLPGGLVLWRAAYSCVTQWGGGEGRGVCIIY